MNYFLISFHYLGQKGDETSSQCNDALNDALKEIVVLRSWLSKKNIQSKLAYAWPDGSLYEYMKTEHTKDELDKILQEGLQFFKMTITIDEALVESAEINPHKYNAKTLEDYFK